MKKRIVIVTLLVLFVLLGVVFFNYAHNITGDLPTEPWQPAQIQVPALHINAPVMSVGQSASGVMDAPVSTAYNSPYWTSVFWDNQGAAPGQAGNMVIAGHVDRVGGDPAVFWSLGSLRPGDMITITTVQGSVYHYVVDGQASYPASYPSQDAISAVFGPTGAHHLNLITCSGVWTGNGYDQRLVIFASQVE